MTVYKGKLQGRQTGYSHHSVELAFESRQAAPGVADSPLLVPFSTRGVSNDAGAFTLELPDDIEPVGPIRLAVFDPSGARLLEETRDALPPATEVLQLDVQPSAPFELGDHPDPFVDAPALFSGHLIERTGRPTVGGRQVVLFGTRKLSDAGGADPIETVLGIAQSARTGYFSMPYPRLFLTSARIEVSGNVDPSGTDLTLSDDGRLPSKIRLVVEIPEDPPTAGEPPDVARAPEPEDLINAPEVFTTDPAVGRCVKLNTPNRTLEEYQYFTSRSSVRPIRSSSGNAPSRRGGCGKLAQLSGPRQRHEDARVRDTEALTYRAVQRAQRSGRVYAHPVDGGRALVSVQLSQRSDRL